MVFFFILQSFWRVSLVTAEFIYFCDMCMCCLCVNNSWSNPCQKLYPDLCQLVKRNESQFATFLKVDVDVGDDIAIECNVSALPTYQVYLNGKQIDSLKKPKRNKLNELFAKTFELFEST